MASINFLYRSSKSEAYLNVRLLFRFHDSEFKKGYKDIVLGAKTKLKVSEHYWNKQHNLKRVKDVEVVNRQSEVNAELNSIKSYVLDAFEKSDPSNVDKEWLVSALNDYYSPKTKAQKIPEDLISFIKYYIEERQEDISEASIKKFNVIRNKMIRMQAARGKTILISEIGETFKQELIKYYKKEKYSQNTIQRELVFIKSFCKYAKKKGLPTHPELLDLKVKKEPVKSIYLSFEELEKIQNKEYSKEHLDNARDWLIISCYTGQRISDFMRFTSDMIRVENGKSLIEFKQKKTKKLMTIPVHPKVQEILNKRDGQFPRAISDQKYNDYIKTVCQLAKINDKVSGKIQANIDPEADKSKIRRVPGKYEKWKLVSSHIGRRSFASNFYGHNNIPTSYLIYVTGHTTEAAFLNYIGKSNKDLALELTNYF